MKMKKSRIVFAGFVLAVFVASLMLQPVAAWSEVGVEWYDDVDEIMGDWYEDDNEALEGGVFGGYGLEIIFRIDNVDLTADVYKIRIDYDGYDQWPPETILLYYRWGSSGGYEYSCSFGSTVTDFKITIDDATSTHLYIKIIDYSRWLDFLRDKWYFGREPELWMYWY